MSGKARQARALQKLHQRRRAARRRRLGRSTLGWTMLGLVLLAGAGLLVDRLMDPAAFPIRELTFEGEFERLEPEALESTVSRAVDGNFFAVDLARIEQAAESLDWVREARVRRVWPDGVHVAVTEHTLVARWGNDAWLNEHGETVRIADVERPDMLRLSGPDGSSAQVLRRAREWSAGLGSAGLTLKALTLNERRAWYAVVSRGEPGAIFSVALGRDGVPLRFERFVKAFRALPGDKAAAVDHIDARYPNGIALRLKHPVNSEDSA